MFLTGQGAAIEADKAAAHVARLEVERVVALEARVEAGEQIARLELELSRSQARLQDVVGRFEDAGTQITQLEAIIEREREVRIEQGNAHAAALGAAQARLDAAEEAIEAVALRERERTEMAVRVAEAELAACRAQLGEATARCEALSELVERQRVQLGAGEKKKEEEEEEEEEED